MRPIVTDQVAWYVSLSVTLVCPAKTAEPIEMLLIWVEDSGIGPGNHACIRWGPDPAWEGAILMGSGVPHCKV